MAKVNIKFGKITPFGVFFHVRDTKAFGLKRSMLVSSVNHSIPYMLCLMG